MTTSFSIKNTAFASLDMQGADTAPLSPIDFLTRAAHVFADKSAIIYEDRRFDYRTVYQRCRRLASALQRSGIVPVGAKEKSHENFRPSEQLDGFLERNRYLLNPKKVADFSSEAGNLIHSDPKVAKQHGFRAPIAAGLMGLHFYRKFIVENFETKSFDLQVWFRRPMFWDDELSLFVKEYNFKTFDMHLLGSNGKPTSNCRLKLY